MVEVRQHVESDVASRVCLILSSFPRSLALSLPFQLRSSKVAEDFTSLEEEAAEMVEMKREKSFSQLMPSRPGSRSVVVTAFSFFPSSQKSTWRNRLHSLSRRAGHLRLRRRRPRPLDMLQRRQPCSSRRQQHRRRRRSCFFRYRRWFCDDL